jgi:hypothetical protein
MLSLYNTTAELVPVFHEYRILVPAITGVVMKYTLPEHAYVLGETGCPAEEAGGAVLTYTVAVPDPVPPVGQDVFPTVVTV